MRRPDIVTFVEYFARSLREELRQSLCSLHRIRLSDFRVLILDRYIFRELAMSFIAVMAFCTLLILVVGIFTKFQDIMKNDVPLDKAFWYFVFSTPYQVMQIVPIAAMLGVLFSIGNPARNNEMLALMTNGVHGLRIAAPVIFGGLVVFVWAVFMNEIVVPPAEQQARYLDRRYLAGESEEK